MGSSLTFYYTSFNEDMRSKFNISNDTVDCVNSQSKNERRIQELIMCIDFPSPN